MPVFKNVKVDTDPKKNYTTASLKYTEQAVRKYIREHTPFVQYAEDGLPRRDDLQGSNLSEGELHAERQKLRPWEVDTLLNHKDEIIQAAVEDRLVMEAKPPQKLVESFVRLHKPDYTPLKPAEMEHRAQISDAMRKKYAEFAAKRNMCTGLALADPPELDRTEQCLLKVDVTEEGLKWNSDLKRDLSSNDPKVKKRAYERALNRIAEETDIEHLDLTDDNFILNNLEKYSSMLSSGAELQSLVDSYKALGGDIDSKLAKNFERLFAIYDAAMPLRAKIDVMASPMYSQVRTEELFGLETFDGRPAIGKDGEPVEPGRFLYADQNQTEDEYYICSFTQVCATNAYISGIQSPLMDKSRTPEQRYQAFCEDYRAREERKRQQEAQAQERKAQAAKAKEAEINKYVRQDLLPQNLTPAQRQERIEAEIRLRKNIEATQDVIKQFNEGVDKKYDKRMLAITDKYLSDSEKADMNLAGEERERELEKLTRQKNEAITNLEAERAGEKLKELSVSEDQVQAYLSPERMELHKRAKETARSQEERVSMAGKIKSVPDAFKRSLFASLGDPQTPQGKFNNERISGFIGNPDYESQLRRKEMIVKNAEQIQNLDESAMSWDKPLNDIGSYALDHMDTCELGYEFQNTYQSMEKSLGFTEKDSVREQMNYVKDKGVYLGGRGILLKEMMKADSFLQFPFEQMDSDQLSALKNAATDHPEKFGLRNEKQADEIIAFMRYKGELENKDDIVAPVKPERETPINTASFEDVLPDMDVIRQQLESVEARLQATDHWYNKRSSSDEYRTMCESLARAKEQFGKIATAQGNPQQLCAAYSDLTNAVDAYITHVGETPKNANQSTRLEAARNLQQFITQHQITDLTVGMIHNNAVASPEERERYEAQTMTKRPEPEQPKQKEITEDIQQKLDAEAAISEELKEDGKEKTNAAEKQLYTMIVNARNGMMRELQKPEFDPEAVKQHLAKAITCGTIRKKLEGEPPAKPDPNYEVQHERQTRRFTDMSDMAAKNYLINEMTKLMESESFRNISSKITEENVHKFLMEKTPSKSPIMNELNQQIKKQNAIRKNNEAPNRVNTTEKTVSEGNIRS